MIKKLLLCLAVLLPSMVSGAQESYNDRVKKYVDQYSQFAIAEQLRAGVPASITLGQGILETEAGNSELMTMANNHFGIKCRNDYQGDFFLHDDDKPQEKFKKYTCATESYKDHSDHLKRNARYATLFTIPQTDYAGWARGLKKCGYATNPQYATRLIKIIEDFNLQQYTLAAIDSGNHKLPVVGNEVKTIGIAMRDTSRKLNSVLIASAAKTPVYQHPATAEDTAKKPLSVTDPVKPPTTSFDQVKSIADSARHRIKVTQEPVTPTALAARPIAKIDTPQKPQPPSVPAPTTATDLKTPSTDIKYDSGKVIIVNGLKAFYAYKDEILLQYAVKYNIRYPRLLEINDIPDAPLSSNMLIYLERKLTSGTHARHTVKEGETMLLIAQTEGVQLKRLITLNKLESGDEPATGAIIELQTEAAKKPLLRRNAIAVRKESTINRPTPSDDFIPVSHPTHTDSVKAQQAGDASAIRPGGETRIIKPAAPATPVQKKEPVIAKTQTVAAPAKEVIAQPVATVQPILQDTAKKIIDTTAEVDSVDATPLVKPVLTMDTAAPISAGHELQADTSTDDLEILKKELDKVVYADDSKIPVAQSVKPADPKKADVKKVTPKAEVKNDAKSNGKYYTVKKGDTLSSIAKKNKVTIRQLEKWNDIEPDDLSLGQKLRIKP